jgi:hypothetical protein
MIRRAAYLACLAVLSAGSRAAAQNSPATFPAPAPTTAATVGGWAAAIVERAEQILGTPAQWNRADTGRCPAAAQSFSIRCALQRAVEEAAGIHRDRGPRVAGTAQSPPTDCAFHPASTGWEGSCGSLWDEVPVFSIAPVPGVTTGAWRSDMHPIAVWSGMMNDAEFPVEYEADQVVGLMTTRKYDDAVVGYNNDSTTTFANVQEFFRQLRDRVAARGTADLRQSGDEVEIEIYPGGTGVMRTYNGWFAVSGFSAGDALLRFRVDTAKQIPPSALDREILERAAAIITSDAVWNRADNRKCPPTATTWSIYCAVERAEVEVTGGFHHRRPAMELVRQIVDERAAKKTYQHRLMGYNNDPATHLEDVRSLFAEAIGRIK